MIPQQIVYLQRFPLNTNGKIDRKAVIEMAKKIRMTKTEIKAFILLESKRKWNY